jgi:DNA-binding response OmpR family regulator
MLSHNIRVLLVEDNSIIALMMESMLEDLGYWVVGPLHNLSDGLDHARDDDIDFAVLDFDLGNGTDVIPIVDILNERNVPYLIATGESAATIHAQLPGAVILSKPVLQDELERALP